MDINNFIRVNDAKNCPNCGAPIQTDICPYCGTTFIDFSCIDADKPFWLKIKMGDKIIIQKVRLMTIDTRVESPVPFYYDNEPIFIQYSQDYYIDLSFVNAS